MFILRAILFSSVGAGTLQLLDIFRCQRQLPTSQHHRMTEDGIVVFYAERAYKATHFIKQRKTSSPTLMTQAFQK